MRSYNLLCCREREKPFCPNSNCWLFIEPSDCHVHIHYFHNWILLTYLKKRISEFRYIMLLFGIFKQRLQLFCLESKWCSYKIKTTNKDILIMYSSLEIGMSFSFLLRICYQGYKGLIKQVGSVFLFFLSFLSSLWSC